MLLPVARSIAIVYILTWLSACSVNPVTGERQLSFISASEELAMGEQQYIPTQQLQGGKFYLSDELTNYVESVGQKLAGVSDRPDLPYEFVVLNSGVPNAWALPGGKIAINRGLLTEMDNEAELAAVLGHEIVHAAARHSVQRMQQGLLLNVGLAGLGMALGENQWSGLIIGGAGLGSQIALAQYSQSNELESDHYGIEYMKEAGYDPQAAVALQEIFLRLSQNRASGFMEGLFATHPPSAARVRKNQELVDEIGAGGYIGKEAYQQKTAILRRLKPAYEAHQQAIEQFKAGNLDAALASADKALSIESREAMFHEAKGQILEKSGRKEDALKSYSKAVDLYPDMFVYRLERGLLLFDLNRLEPARDDLAKANSVVPTSIAFLRLGDIAKSQGRRQEAVANYSQAAQSEGAVAEEARRKLQEMGVSPAPQN